jgi:two-component system cell cycle response regulator
MTRARPGFRRRGAGGEAPAERRVEGLGSGSAPFSQTQIRHLLKTEFARARRHGYPFACVRVQVDRLAALADRHGEDVRGAIRLELGALVARSSRGHDYVGDAGDDGLLILLPHSDLAAARIVAERLCSGFRQLELEVGGIPLALGVSVGIAVCEHGETLFSDTLLSQAEVALDWAMREGGDRAVEFDKDRYVEPPLIP